jgi:hypothetical protein
MIHGLCDMKMLIATVVLLSASIVGAQNIPYTERPVSWPLNSGTAPYLVPLVA